MQYEITIKPQAIKDGRKIPGKILKRIFENIAEIGNDLHGDIKQLTNFNPEYQLREELQDFEDMRDLREAKEKEKNSRGMSLSEAKKELNIR
ncbi:MAG TPA: type II toxin-antitoxin system RelE/ParE family toxin [Bacteroidetes bacterium]|nr:type II toxin-antitoxin system RelE/ParE family toxin [Bacteroidota bacterium]